ncbi:MAG: phosphatidylinositol mannoside acyltransferase [Actinomycetota bacterium]|nr:phosphatidylinositol mannoside acyltransferase [Actinomycetota bacterium]
MKARLVALAYAGGWALVRSLPERLVSVLFRLGADVAWRRGGTGVRRLEGNLRRVVGPGVPADALAALTRAGVRSYARYWLEVFRLPVTPQERTVARTRLHDEFHLRDAFASGRGVICALPHSGNWDQAGAWATATGMPFTTVAERLEPAGVFEQFVRFREGLGMEVVPLTGGERPPFALLAERLRAGGMLCLLGDRDLTESGIEVDFFGARTRMPAGPAALAVRTGAVLLPCSLWYDGPDMHLRIHPEVVAAAGLTGRDRIADMTQRVAGAFAEGIAAHPQDWHMLQRLWLDDLDRDDPRRAPVAVPADVDAAS